MYELDTYVGKFVVENVNLVYFVESDVLPYV